jgi:4-aminobutyrate aminotransferase-like enzyme
MTRILHRQIHAPLPVAVGGKGIQLFDAEGRAYIDASGGAAVSCLGHGHPDVVAAAPALNSTGSLTPTPPSSPPTRPKRSPTG